MFDTGSEYRNAAYIILQIIYCPSSKN